MELGEWESLDFNLGPAQESLKDPRKKHRDTFDRDAYRLEAEETAQYFDVPEPEPTPARKVRDFSSTAELRRPVREAAQRMLTTGSLIETPVPEIFHQCLLCRFTGSIMFENMGIEKHVFWRQGKIISATSNHIDDRLDHFLY